jgi:hypothetical protein
VVHLACLVNWPCHVLPNCMQCPTMHYLPAVLVLPNFSACLTSQLVRPTSPSVLSTFPALPPALPVCPTSLACTPTQLHICPPASLAWVL